MRVVDRLSCRATAVVLLFWNERRVPGRVTELPADISLPVAFRLPPTLVDLSVLFILYLQCYGCGGLVEPLCTQVSLHCLYLVA